MTNRVRTGNAQWDNPTMEILKGKVALVTGGNRGIGAAEVAINFRTRSGDAEKVCAEIRDLGRRTLALQADVSKSDQVKKLVAQTEQELGAVQILVNNAGMMRPRKPEEITEEDWDEHINVNLKSAFLVTQAVLPH